LVALSARLSLQKVLLRRDPLVQQARVIDRQKEMMVEVHLLLNFQMAMD
jgi:hypothetical protein